MMRAATPLLLLTLSSALAACSAAATSSQEGYLTRDQGKLWFKGELNEESVAHISAQLVKGDTLIINSGGGEQKSAIKLGNDIVDKGVTVSVNKRCHSACALFVFAPAPSKEIMRGSYVWFHNSPAFWSAALAASPRKISPAMAAAIRSNDASARALLKRAGVDWSVMTCIDNATGADPRAIGAASPASALEDGEAPTAELKYNFVSLSPSVMRQYGIIVEHDFEHDQSRQSDESLNSYFDVKLKQVKNRSECEA
ncbi:hypothetical protein CFHF_19755 [Caulobacter flavus]|uniref:Lipoprotein n=1 Tax=Caulobacter flavus TaxID=1679497 RepID=A0A2N5CP16_9CAUL|nr:hypothetical protein [Caulobacter flavus]AYV48593.1 hypothetical protein C1707_21310 [Caulobacter flavus]PLR08691.1 hypothetical protein CFHF_19755 [Caulobacter flavus]